MDTMVALHRLETAILFGRVSACTLLSACEQIRAIGYAEDGIRLAHLYNWTRPDKVADPDTAGAP